MRLCISVLGTEVLTISTDPDDEQSCQGDVVSIQAGFVSPIEQPAREAGRDYE